MIMTTAWSIMSDHDRSWAIMSDHDWSWSLCDHSRIEHDRSWLVMIDHDWSWQIMTNHDRSRSVMIDHWSVKIKINGHDQNENDHDHFMIALWSLHDHFMIASWSLHYRKIIAFIFWFIDRLLIALWSAINHSKTDPDRSAIDHDQSWSIMIKNALIKKILKNKSNYTLIYHLYFFYLYI